MAKRTLSTLVGGVFLLGGQMADRYLTGSKIKEAWMKRAPRFARRDERIDHVRRLMNGELELQLPKNWEIEGKEWMAYSSPSKITIPLKTSALLQAKRPLFQRHRHGEGIPAEAAATLIEQWTDAMVNHTLVWEDLVDLMLNEAECGIVVTPAPAHWEELPTFLDTIDERAYQRLHPRRRQAFRPYDKEKGRYARVDASGEPVPRRRYQLDAQGRSPDEAREGFELDMGRSRRAYSREKDDFMARRPPLVARLIPATDCIPLWKPSPRPRDMLEGMLVRTVYSREELIRRSYSWDESVEQGLVTYEDGGPTLSTGGYGSSTGELELYEAFMLDEHGEPYISYSVGGAETSVGKGKASVIHLGDEYGLTRLPAHYAMGMRFRRTNRDNPGTPMGVPLLWPLMRTILSEERIITAMTMHVWMHGFMSFAVTPDAELIRDNPEAWLEDDKPRKLQVEPMTIVNVPGRVVPLASPTVSEDVKQLALMYRGSITEEAPPPAAFGGQGATSGHDRSLIGDQTMVALGQTRKGLLDAWQFVGELALEYGARMGETLEDDIPVYANIPNAQGAGAKRGILKLDPRKVGDDFEVTTYYPKVFGEDPALTSLMLEAWAKGASPFEEMREVGFNDPAPEITRLKLFLDEYYRSDDGRREILQYAAQQASNERMAKVLELQAEGLVDQGGTPMGLFQGTPLDPAAQGGSPLSMGALPGATAPASGSPGGASMGMATLPNAAQAQLAGIVSGGMESRSIMADSVAGGRVGS